MGRQTIIYFLICLILVSCIQKTKESKELKEQKNKIKSKTTLEYFTDKIDSDAEGIKMRTVELFDTNNICIERAVYDESEKGKQIEHFYIESKNDTMFKYWMFLFNSSSLELAAKETYFHNLKIAEWTANNGGGGSYFIDSDLSATMKFGVQFEKLFFYDKNDKLVRTKISSQDGSWITTEYVYKGDTLEKKNSYSNTGIVDSVAYFYDKKGRKIELVEGFICDSPSTKVETNYKRYYRYNDRDSLIGSSHYKDSKLFLKYEYQYNSEGNVMVENAYGGFENDDTTRLDQITEYYYSSNKLAQQTVYFGNTGHPFLMEYYKYDSFNNLIEKRKFVNNSSSEGRSYFDRRTTRYYYEYY